LPEKKHPTQTAHSGIVIARECFTVFDDAEKLHVAFPSHVRKKLHATCPTNTTQRCTQACLRQDLEVACLLPALTLKRTHTS
jgi:hypothetical protein